MTKEKTKPLDFKRIGVLILLIALSGCVSECLHYCDEKSNISKCSVYDTEIQEYTLNPYICECWANDYTCNFAYKE